MWNEFSAQASPQSNKEPSEIARSGFVPMRDGSDNVEYRDAIEYIVDKTKLQSIEEVFDIDESQDRLLY